MKDPITEGTIVPIEQNGTCRILAAGPLSKQPSSTAYRIVLVSLPGRLVVYTEFFNGWSDVKSSRSFSNGHYFKSDQLAEATESFGKKVAEHAEFLKSLYRED